MRSLYNQLLALRQNIPESEHVSKKYVEEFHSILKEIESATSSSLSRYYIAASILEHTSGVYRPGAGFVSTGELKCERGLLLSKIDSVLLNFNEEEKPPMGFTTA